MPTSLEATPDAQAQVLHRDSRRARVFENACVGMLVTLPAFYLLGVLQGGWRMKLVFTMATVIGIAIASAGMLSRRGRLSAGVHLVTAAGCFVLLAGSLVGGRIGPAGALFPTFLSVALFHTRPAHILGTFCMTLGCLLVLGVSVPAIDPVYVPTLLCATLLLGMLIFFNARATEKDLGALIEANLALEGARRQADAANQAKSVFLATMSHELRTPLNAVIGYAEMLRQQAEDDDLEPEEAREDLERIEGAGRQLLRLVSRVLDISRVEAGQFELHPEPVALDELLAGIATAASPNPSVTVHCAASDPAGLSVDADRGVLTQIVEQLVANACQFTRQGTITLGATRTPEGIEITVRDTGIGIDEADVERIFGLFTQLDGSSTRTVDGAGLGLALCRRLAEQLGATLTVESQPGQGSTFTLHLQSAD